MLFRMVPKHDFRDYEQYVCFRAVLFRMVPKYVSGVDPSSIGFRAVLFRMVPKLRIWLLEKPLRF